MFTLTGFSSLLGKHYSRSSEDSHTPTGTPRAVTSPKRVDHNVLYMIQPRGDADDPPTLCCLLLPLQHRSTTTFAVLILCNTLKRKQRPSATSAATGRCTKTCTITLHRHSSRHEPPTPRGKLHPRRRPPPPKTPTKTVLERRVFA